DRYFIDRLATRVLEVENGGVTLYEGNYEDYLRRKEAEASAADLSTQIHGAVPTNSAGMEPSREPENVAQSRNGSAMQETAASDGNRSRRLNPIKQKQMEDRCVFLEEEVPRIEAAIAHTEEQLGVYVSAAETQRLTNLAATLREQLTALTTEWEELMLQLEGA
ncbi:MAG: ABC transporter ATP-binding protein, partial [Terracidiphilus sp.]